MSWSTTQALWQSRQNLPPEALSVSLNVMPAGGAQGWLDQYRFDVERGSIAGVLGTPASHGCVRMSNADIAECFDQIAEGTPVEIVA